VGSTLALAQPHYYDRLVQLASTIKFVHHVSKIDTLENDNYYFFFLSFFNVSKYDTLENEKNNKKINCHFLTCQFLTR
jgi:hypothetical protein